jgi:transposase
LHKEIEIRESLEHGSIILWKRLWDRLSLSRILKQQLHSGVSRVQIEAEKYIEMMVINRCIEPLSKLGGTRWIERTSYKVMKGYSELPYDVEHFYRSMDYLLKIKEALESRIYHQLKNLFSVIVKLTFYDITSTFFYSDSCPLSANGYSRDNRSDKVQIVVGIVTSFEGYPIKHYVFKGNTKDETTVSQVVTDLKKRFHIEETIFVGDRGMITKLNITTIEEEGFDYIMGVKHRQSEITEMIFTENDIEKTTSYTHKYNGLFIQEHIVAIRSFLRWKYHKLLQNGSVKVNDQLSTSITEYIEKLTNSMEVEYKDVKKVFDPFDIDKKVVRKCFNVTKKYMKRYEDSLRMIICLNKERKKESHKKRHEKITSLFNDLENLFKKQSQKKEFSATEMEKKVSAIFGGYKSKYRKYFHFIRDQKTDKVVGFTINQNELDKEKKYDGTFILTTNRFDLPCTKVVESYKNLKEVEILIDDLKNYVDIRPVRHWLLHRVEAHVFLCILSLLLKRIFEIDCMKSKAIMESLEEISKVKLVYYKIRFSEREQRYQIIPKVSQVNDSQMKIFKKAGINNPMSLENYVW